MQEMQNLKPQGYHTFPNMDSISGVFMKDAETLKLNDN